MRGSGGLGQNFGPFRMLKGFISEVNDSPKRWGWGQDLPKIDWDAVSPMRRLLLLLPLSVLAVSPARADLHITRDHGGYVEEYKVKFKQIRDSRQRVIIDGICNSACTLVFGIVPMNKICVTPRASIGFHQAYYDKAFTFGIKVTSPEGTSDLMSYYPEPVKDWIRRNGGLTTEMKKITNGVDLWKIVDPCPESW